jgi:hypothetical protein
MVTICRHPLQKDEARRIGANIVKLPNVTRAATSLSMEGSLQRCFFTIRGRHRVVKEDPDGTYLPDVAAALSYAEYTVRELRKKSGRNDTTLIMVVQDQARQPVLFVPFFPGS